MKKIINKTSLPLIIAPIILFSPIIFSGKALFWGTPSTQFVPWWEFAWSSIISGDLPLWNPWLGMGSPLVANYQIAIFYPPYWIYLLLLWLGGVDWMAWGMALIVVLHLILAGIGTARLLDDLGVSELGQVIGGLAYSLSGYLVGRAGFLSINASVAWIPWILLFTKRLGICRSAFWKTSIFLAFLLLAGHAQTGWYTILLAVSWTAFWAIKDGKHEKRWWSIAWSWLNLAGAGLLASGISAIQLIPTAQYLWLSQRASEYGYQDAMTYSFWPWRLITLIIPDIFGNPGDGTYWGYGNYWEDAVYIGLIPIIVAIGLMVSWLISMAGGTKDLDDESSDKKGLVGYLALTILISFLLAFGKNTFVFPFLYKYIPTFNLFQAPTRFTIWAEISFVLLAGIGIDQIKKPKGKGLYATRLIAAGCVAVTLGAILTKILIPDIKTTFIRPSIQAGLIGLGFVVLILYSPSGKEKKTRGIWSWALILLVTIDLILAGWKLNPGIEKDFYQVQTQDGTQGRIFMPVDLEYELKYNHFFLFNSFEPIADWSDMKEYYLPNLNMLRRREMVNNFDPLLSARYQSWLGELQNTDLLERPELLEIMAVNGIIARNNKGDIELQDIPGKVEYVKLYDCIVNEEFGANILPLIFGEGINLNDTLIVEDASDANISCNKVSPGIYSIISSKPGHLSLDVDLRENAWIFWSQEWYPGWMGYIDGQQANIKRANYLFQAVYCPAGQHTIEFVYRPKSFLVGSAISGISLLILMIGFWERKRSEIRVVD